MSSRKVIVIGGGPSGMMAAATAASKGYRVVLLERNEKLGKKLYITGKGRCNITNACELDDFFSNIPRNSRFLYSAIHRYTSQDLISFLHQEGLETVVERGNRVFPASNKASDVTKILEKYLKKMKVEIKCNFRVRHILSQAGKAIGITEFDGTSLASDVVILCTGGVSYPSTGSTGDGYGMAKELGHEITPVLPSLIPLVTKELWVRSLQGLTLKNVCLSAFVKEKEIFKETGELLFTHFGISGPLVLSLSSHIADKNLSDIVITIDLKPALNEEQLNNRLVRDFEKYNRKQFKNALADLLPQKMIPVFIELSHISGDKYVHQISKIERKALVGLMKSLEIRIVQMRPIEEAIITRGGINIKNIDPSTMASKLIQGLYFAGEVIDVDGYTGGFNLQIAFSTGFLAGHSC